MSAATVSQPAPTGDGQDVTELVVADLRARSDEGLRRYGTRLKTGNGRVALVDLYQEILDAACYLRQELTERGIK